MLIGSVLIVCNDVVGAKMAGPAIRCVEIAKILSLSCEVKLAAPRVDESISYSFDVFPFSDRKFRAAAEAAAMIIIQGDALKVHPFLKDSKAIIVADLYCPISLEYHQVSDGVEMDIRAATNTYLSEMSYEQLVYADHFLCATEKQRDYWLGALTLAGRINAYRWPRASHADISELISLLPFGLSSVRPVLERPALRTLFNIPADEFVLVWGGGIYQWFDPLTIISAVHHLVSQGYKIHLVFIGVKHPNPGITQHDMCANAIALATELGLINQFVHFNFGWVEYSDRHNYLLDADVGVSAHFNNPETRFSFRTRMLDYLWCGLPIICTRGDFFGDAVQAEGVGISIEYEDVDGWINALKAVLLDREVLEQYKVASLKYSESYSWDTLVSKSVERFKILTHSPDREFNRNAFREARVSTRSNRLRKIYKSGGFKSVLAAALRRVKRALH